MQLSRRSFLSLSGACLAAAGLPRITLADSRPGEYTLIAEAASVEILPGTQTPGLLFNGGVPAPVLRVKQGERLRVKFINRLNEPTTIHWHGVRLDIAMDGVPWLSQKPVMPGETFIYDFVCPDAGSFWYHPHMNSVEQLGRGLVGTLIVEEREPVGFDADLVLQARDWRLHDDGQFMKLSDHRKMGKAGTFGNVRTVNGELQPVFEIPAGGAIRARLLNLDNTRIYRCELQRDVEQFYPAEIIATDSCPLNETWLLDNQMLGPGMRFDIAFRAPEAVGQEIRLVNNKVAKPYTMAVFRTVAAKRPVNPQMPKLPTNPLGQPDLTNAPLLRFAFDSGAMSPVKKDGKIHYKFWTINRRSWEGMHKGFIPEPMAKLKLGKTYIFELQNLTPHSHPIHIHGHFFYVLESNKRTIIPHQADTVMITPKERVKVALLADNPGRWMYHCHIIEHMKTGMMGWIDVS